VQEPGDFANHRLPIGCAVCGYLLRPCPGGIGANGRRPPRESIHSTATAVGVSFAR
jgi:hypothetical protein